MTLSISIRPQFMRGWLRVLIRKIRTIRRDRAHYVYLLQVEDHILKDIGVDRSRVREELRRTSALPLFK